MSQQDPDPSPVRVAVAGTPPGGSVMANKFLAIGGGMGPDLVKGICADFTKGLGVNVTKGMGIKFAQQYGEIVNLPFLNMQTKMRAPGGVLDFTRVPQFAADTAATAATLAPAHQFEFPEPIDWNARLDELDIDFVAPASDDTIRELLEEFRAEAERTRIRHEADLEVSRLRYEASEAGRRQDRLDADAARREDRGQADADRAAETRRYRIMLIATVIGAAFTAGSAFLGGLALAG